VVRHIHFVQLPDGIEFERRQPHVVQALPGQDFIRQPAYAHPVTVAHPAHLVEPDPQVFDLNRAWQRDQVIRRDPTRALDDFKVLAQRAAVTLKLSQA
jgi:hypothetical protein